MSVATLVRLYRVELKRLAHRRAVRGLVAFPFAIYVIQLVATIISNKSPRDLHNFYEDWFFSVELTAGFCAVLAGLISATAIGAEWSSGGFATLMTWAPDRRAVLLAKSAAVATVSVALTAALLAFNTCCQWVTAKAIGNFDRGNATAGDSVSYGLRALVVVGLIAITTVGLAVVVKSSAAVIGVIMGYLIGVEVILRLTYPWMTRYTLLPHAIAAMSGSYEAALDSNDTFAVLDGSSRQTVMHLSGGGALLELVIFAILVTCAAGVLLQRRDVT